MSEENLMLEVGGSSSKAVSAMEKVISKLQILQTSFAAAVPSVTAFNNALNSIGAGKADSAFARLSTNVSKATQSIDKQILSSAKSEAQMAMYQARMDRAAASSARAQQTLDKLAESNQKVTSEAKWAAEAEQSLTDAITRCVAAGKNVQSSVGLPTSAPLTGSKTASEMLTGNLGISEAMDSMDKATSKTKQLKSELSGVSAPSNKAAQSIKKIGEAAKTASSHTNTFSKVIGNLKTYLLTGILYKTASFLSDSIKNSMDYTENMNLFSVALGENAEKAGKFVDSMQAAFGLNPSNLVKNMGVFYQTSTAMGVASNNAYTLSENFTKLAEDIASYYNISVESANEKLNSGLVGQTKPLREIGVITTENALQQTAYANGVEKSVSKMTEAEKIHLRYLTILQQTKNAQGDFARTIDSPANSAKILTEQMAQLSRAIGSLFIPILTRVLPYIIAFARALTIVINGAAALAGYESPSYGNATTDYFGNLADDADNAGSIIGDTTSKVKELKNQVMGFDEVNILTKNDSSSTSGSSSGVGGDNLGIGNYAGYDNLMNTVDSKTEALTQRIVGWLNSFKQMLPVIVGIGAALLAWRIASPIIDVFSGIGKLVGLTGGGSLLTKLGLTSGIELLPFAGAIGTFVYGLSWVEEHSGFVSSGLNAIWSGVKNVIKAIGSLNVDWSTVGMGAFLGIQTALLFTPAAPLVVALDAVGAAISVVGYFAQPALEKVNLFGGVSDKTREKVEPFTDSIEELNKKFLELDFGNSIISEEDVEYVTTRLTKIKSTLLGGVDESRTKALSDLIDLKNSGVEITDEMYQKMLKGTNDYYGNTTDKVNEGCDKITDILNTAKKNGVSVTDEQWTEIHRIEADMQKTGIETLSDTEKDANTILERMRNSSTQITAEEAAEVVRTSKAAMDTKIQNANDTYEKTKATLEHQRDDLGTISAEEANSSIQAAERERDGKIQAAKDGHAGVVSEAQQQAGEHMREVDWETGEIRDRFGALQYDLSHAHMDQPNWLDASSWVPWLENWEREMQDRISQMDLFRPMEYKSLHVRGYYDYEAADAGFFQFFGLPGTPKLDVQWYANGGVFDSPQVIGIGEAGREAALPMNDTVYAEIAKGINDNSVSNPKNVNGFSTDAIVSEIHSLKEAIKSLKLDVALYSNDREIAKSSNRGNAMIDRRTNPIAST